MKLRKADLSVVTTDELGQGDSFGEGCMLEDRRLRSTLNACHGDERDRDRDRLSMPTDGEDTPDRVAGCGAETKAIMATAGKSLETYQTLEVLLDAIVTLLCDS